MDGPIAVSTGFTWTAAGAWGTFLAVIGLIIRQVGPWRKITLDAQEKLITTLTERVTSLERRIESERNFTRVQAARIEARHEAQTAQYRHKIGNADQALEALFSRLEAGMPVADAVRYVREMRERQRDEERRESALINAAEIAAVATVEAELIAERRSEAERS